MTGRDEERSRDAATPPGAAQDSGPLRGDHPIEPKPAERTDHPAPDAEKASETIRPGGEPESRDDR